MELLGEALTGSLYVFALHRASGIRDVAEEIVQATALRAIRELPRYDPRRANNRILRWLIGLALNEMKSVRGKRGFLHPVGGREELDALRQSARLNCRPMPQEVLDREETHALVGATLAELAPDRRAVLEAKYFDRKSVSQIASECGKTAGAVESSLDRARGEFGKLFRVLAREVLNGLEGER